MCVCSNDSVTHFNNALRSVTEFQTRVPNEVVIVLDGNVSLEIVKIIETVFYEIPITHHIVKNKKQMGLAYSLNHGLEFCTKEWVARMDADDISLPERFSEQMSYLEKNPSTTLLGTSIREFGNHINERDKIAITDINKIKKN
jgi:glycosyltransferase involved in cell wall biosynthesis